ncbi:MAG: hypothetical protein ACYC1C_07675, partial [Chloroflexota bacterium]
TRSQAARVAKQTLLRARAKIVGVVINRVSRQAVSYYDYHSEEQSDKSRLPSFSSVFGHPGMPFQTPSTIARNGEQRAVTKHSPPRVQ